MRLQVRSVHWPGRDAVERADGADDLDRPGAGQPVPEFIVGQRSPAGIEPAQIKGQIAAEQHPGKGRDRALEKITGRIRSIAPSPPARMAAPAPAERRPLDRLRAHRGQAVAQARRTRSRYHGCRARRPRAAPSPSGRGPFAGSGSTADRAQRGIVRQVVRRGRSGNALPPACREPPPGGRHRKPPPRNRPRRSGRRCWPAPRPEAPDGCKPGSQR